MIELPPVLNESPVRVEFGPGAIARLAQRAAELQPGRILLVADPAMRTAGHLKNVADQLSRLDCEVRLYEDVAPNPTTATVADCAARLSAHKTDLVVALGGGSAMDTAKAANLVATNGGRIADYAGDPDLQTLQRRASLLPMIMVPTTAGTGSEAQSFALISDEDSHTKMACGDRRLPTQGGMRPRFAILDPALTATVPRTVVVSAGLDAVVHAIETAGSTRRTAVSRRFSIEAWKRLAPALEAALSDPAGDDTAAHMLLGAHLAGAAIEFSMLGAAHACANPLTARYGIVHGLAVGLMVPHVVAFNAASQPGAYADLEPNAGAIVQRVGRLLSLAGAATRLHDLGVPQEDLPELANLAGQQWTARYNPVPVGPPQLLQIYQAAY